ncbi:uncharacterized protein GGS25DRAFT_523294 [Hypoxylon fragiforme]|uniref:uncharacterized protein n=1 Tax=Hypoxylon fragiforme TaxID=63214 RepID=UPI0020C60E1C|nr:uncharacterized protein GGS25DRAFT_523294 [Hypoxylon fragiforme]KAI2607767.1 hypothetical protein GGS25DRAFT_523294 [Hypoxylon fragiforme]
MSHHRKIRPLLRALLLLSLPRLAIRAFLVLAPGAVGVDDEDAATFATDYISATGAVGDGVSQNRGTFGMNYF